jgi:uncharacterized membrane protein YfcA
MAIALTAIVHFLNNLFKLSLLGKNANKQIVLKFGVPALLFSFVGAAMLTYINDIPPILQYSVFDKVASVTPIKLIISVLLICFSLIELIPKLANIQFNQKYLMLGGVLSGFFGGLSGNQGALRSAFLLRANLSKEAFIATGVIIACLIDTSRLIVYGEHTFAVHEQINVSLVVAATLSAFLGAYIGNKVLKKVTIQSVQYIVAIMLIVFSVLLGSGII